MSNNWDGKGLPQIGEIISLAKRFPNPYQIRVVAIDEGNVVGRAISGQLLGSYYSYKLDEIESIKSDRDKAIDELKQIFNKTWHGFSLDDAMSAIYDAGYRKVKSGE